MWSRTEGWIEARWVGYRPAGSLWDFHLAISIIKVHAAKIGVDPKDLNEEKMEQEKGDEMTKKAVTMRKMNIRMKREMKKKQRTKGSET